MATEWRYLQNFRPKSDLHFLFWASFDQLPRHKAGEDAFWIFFSAWSNFYLEIVPPRHLLASLHK